MTAGKQRVIGSDKSDIEKRMPLLNAVVSEPFHSWHVHTGLQLPSHVYDTDKSVTVTTPWWMVSLPVCNWSLHW
jgi:hypothetical protein